MESSLSTPQCSFVVYLDKDASLLPPFLRDLRTFFAKFPVHYELVAVVEKGARECLQILRQNTEPKLDKELLTIKENISHLGRAKSLYEALSIAQAPTIIVVSPELATPLGDAFKMWQHLVAEEHFDICWGDRYKRKDSLFKHTKSARLHTEHFFNELYKHKHQGLLQDPLCEIFAIKKTCWNKFRSEFEEKSLKGWYLAPSLQSCPSFKSFSFVEVPIFDSGAMSPSYGVWKERWHLSRQVR